MFQGFAPLGGSDPMSETSPSLQEFFALDHRRCDEKWAEVEAAAQAGDMQLEMENWRSFQDEMLRHLRMEEEVMFPAFEQATGMTDSGPTFMMRSEHEQMRGLIEQMRGVADGEDYDELIDLGDTLLMLIQQHNQKEEQMLYPMAERALAADWAKLLERLIKY
jgi:hemerythrin-like domain-containing protein